VPYALTDHPSQDGRCAGDAGVGDMDRSEQACLLQLSGTVVRRGPELQIKFRNFRTTVFRDKSRACQKGSDDCEKYKLTGYFPRHSFLLIEIDYNEGGQWMLVNLRTGTQTKIHAPPHYSPHENWLVSVCSSIGPSGCGNGMDIVATAPERTPAEWHHLIADNDEALYEFDAWDGDERVKLTVTPLTGSETRTLRAAVEYIDGTWQLKVPADSLAQ
jgi:hypothetical protein